MQGTEGIWLVPLACQALLQLSTAGSNASRVALVRIPAPHRPAVDHCIAFRFRGTAHLCPESVDRHAIHSPQPKLGSASDLVLHKAHQVVRKGRIHNWPSTGILLGITPCTAGTCIVSLLRKCFGSADVLKKRMEPPWHLRCHEA